MTTVFYACLYTHCQDSCALLLLFDPLEVLCRSAVGDRGQECNTREIIASRNNDGKVRDPSTTPAHHHANGTNQWPKPGQRLCTRSRPGVTMDQQTYNCPTITTVPPTEGDCNPQTPTNPQRKLLQALATLVVCARIEFASSPGLPGHGLLECPPNTPSSPGRGP